MRVYKCQGCGFEIYSEKEINVCPKCGKPMEPVYAEATGYIRLQIAKCITDLLEFKKADESFLDNNDLNAYIDICPSYGDVRRYILGSSIVEKCPERLIKIVDEYQAKVLPGASKSLPITIRELKSAIDLINKSLIKSLYYLGYDYNPKGFYLWDLIANGKSYIEPEYIEYINEIMRLMKDVSLKEAKFIRVNNLYKVNLGKATINYNGKEKKEDKIKILTKVIAELKNALDVPLLMDFFADENKEILKLDTPLWNGLYALLVVAAPTKEITVLLEDKEIKIKDVYKKLDYMLESYFADIKKLVCSKDLYENMDMLELQDAYRNISKTMNMTPSLLSKHKVEDKKGEKALAELIGLDKVKTVVQQIKSYAIANKGNKNLNLHMTFSGNPGSGKTEVARIIADIFYDNKVLPTNKLIETDRAGLVGQYVGETPQKTMSVIESAMGGVLFIDEAYSLVPKNGSGIDYGAEAIATLIKAMEDYRGKFCVILAGYTNPLSEMMDSNPGFKSRIQFNINFPDYSRDELKEIGYLMIHKQDYYCTFDAMDKILDITDVMRRDKNFANARVIRNIIQGVMLVQNLRVLDSKNRFLTIDDVNEYIRQNDLIVESKENNPNELLTNEDKLNMLIGLDGVKRTVKKIKAYAKKNVGNSSFNIHMCFYGNPGSGKTEVARLMSEILYEAGVLKEAKFVETNANDLIGEYIGQTGPKTHDVFMSAMGGVLFIDEAYSLMSQGNGSSFGSEAIATLLKDMEDYRGKICVILAGYKNEIQGLLGANPGFKSRIQFEIDFPDYTPSELKEIASLMVKKNKYEATDEALERISLVADSKRNSESFANAREVRNIIDQVILNQNLRTEDIDSNLITIDDVNEYIEENNIKLDNIEKQEKTLESTSMDVLFRQMGNSELFMLNNLIYNKDIIDYGYLKESIASIHGANSQGTGYMISPTGLCLTCSHCIIDDGSKQEARIVSINSNGEEISTNYRFVLVKRDIINDIAIIKLKGGIMPFKYLTLENKDFSYKPLNRFLMVGYPFGGEDFSSPSFTEGSIASVNYYNNRKIVFADMFGKPGNSGSPVLEIESKKVIGLYFGGIGSGAEIINCFTPIDLIWNLINRREL